METFERSVLCHYCLCSMNLPKLRSNHIDNLPNNRSRDSHDKTQRMNCNKRRPSAVGWWQCKPSQSIQRRQLTTTHLTWNLRLKPKDSQFKSCVYVGTPHRLRSHCPSLECCWCSTVPKIIKKCAPERLQLLKQRGKS